MSRSPSSSLFVVAAHVALNAVVVGALSCAPSTPIEPVSVDVERSFQPRAGGFVSAQECEAAAATLHERDADVGWQHLVACVAHPAFRDLEGLVGAPWPKELARRRGGLGLVARVIARRGGDVGRDLRICRAAGLPLHSLRAALAFPDDVEGGLVVMRGSVDDVRRASAGRAVELAEMRPVTDDDFLSDTDAIRTKARAIHRPVAELSVETGLSVVAKTFGSEDFEPSTDYIVLLRFDGERPLLGARTAIGASQATGTLLASYENANDDPVLWRQ